MYFRRVEDFPTFSFGDYFSIPNRLCYALIIDLVCLNCLVQRMTKIASEEIAKESK